MSREGSWGDGGGGGSSMITEYFFSKKLKVEMSSQTVLLLASVYLHVVREGVLPE